MGSRFSRANFVIAGFFALNAVGLAMIYRAVSPRRDWLTVDDFRPMAVTKVGQPILAAFNLPMCSPEQVGQPPTTQLISFNPPIPGRSKWRSTRELAFYPKKPLLKATEYQARLSDTLTSVDGLSLHEGREFTFRTAPLQLLNVEQVRFSQRARAILRLVFDQDVVPNEIPKYVRLMNRKSKSVSYKLLGESRSSVVNIRTDTLPNDEDLTLVMVPGLRGTEGPLAVEKEVRKRVVIKHILRLNDLSAEVPFGRSAYVEADFNDEIDLKKAKDFLRIEPAIKVELSSSWYGLKIAGEFQPQKRYVLTFLAGLPTTDGDELGKDVTRTIWMPTRQADLKFVHRGGYLSPFGNKILPVKHANISDAELSIARIYDNNIVHYLRTGRDWHGNFDLAKPLGTHTIKLNNPTNEVVTTYIDLNEQVKSEVKGVLLVELEHSGDGWYSDTALLVVSDLGLTVKQNESELLAWAVSLKDGEPVSSVTVKIWSEANQLLASGVTDSQGLVRVVRSWGDESPYVVTATLGDDLTYLELDRGQLSLVDFDVDGRAPLTKGNEAFLFTDRGVIRPAETIRVQGIVRGRDWQMPGEFPVELQVRRPDGRNWKTFNGRLSPSGTVHFELPLPKTALTGEYEVALRVPGSTSSMGQATFLVEDYLPNRLHVAIDAPSDLLTSLGEIDVRVQGTTLVGQPASGLDVEMRQVRRVEPFEHPKWKGWTFEDDRVESLPERRVVGKGQLDEAGWASFTVDLAPQRDRPQGIVVNEIRATVKEVGGRAVTASSRVRCLGNHGFIGLHKKIENGRTDKPFEIGIAFVSQDGSQMPTEDVTVRLLRANWHNIIEQTRRGDYRYRSEREWIETKSETAKLDSSGPLTYPVSVQQAGEYRLAVDLEDDSAGATIDFYIGDGEWQGISWSVSKPERLEIVPDRSRYKVGETGTLLVKTPFPGIALLSLEGTEFHEVRTIRTDQNTVEIPFVVPDSSDGLYASVSMVRAIEPDKTPWSTHRAFGIAPIIVDRTDRQIQVALELPTEVRPSTEIEINVAAGRPGAEVHLYAVDEGILSLTGYATPDPFEWFYGRRTLATETSDLYSRLMPETPRKLLDQSAPGGDGEMGYDPMRQSPISARRRAPVILWLGTQKCNESGQAKFSTVAPDFEGQLRFMAVAVDGESFGSGEDQILVRGPISVEPNLPRFLAPGDVARPTVVIYNHTNQTGEVSVDVTSTGPVEISSLPSQASIPAHGKTVLAFELKATGQIGPASVTIRAQMGDETSKRTVAFPVRPAVSYASLADSGTVIAGESAIIDIPNQWIDGTSTSKLEISGSPTVELNNAWEYLSSYPYGCVEQTTSQLFPLAYLDFLLDADDPDVVTEDIESRISVGMERLWEMQTHEGGLAMWPGQSDSDPFGSLYAALTITELQRRGISVKKDRLGSLMDFCAQRLQQFGPGKPNPNQLLTRAWTCYVLTRAGKPPHAWIRRLREQHQELDTTARSLLAAIYLELGDRATATTLLNSPQLPRKLKRETGGWLDSPARDEAILLSVYLDVDPNHRRITQLVEQLMKQRVNGRWASTQETAFALMALGKYMKFHKNEEAEYIATIQIPDHETLVLNQSDRKTIEIVPNNQPIRLDVRGTGRLHYAWHASGVPSMARTPSLNAGLHIKRLLLGAKGKPIKPDDVALGELVNVHLVITADAPVQNVVLVDLLPAGLEIENPRLNTSQVAKLDHVSLSMPDRVEIRDDRFIAFFDVEDEIRIAYSARAVCEGSFVLPATHAHCQYDEQVQGFGEEATLEVRP